MKKFLSILGVFALGTSSLATIASFTSTVSTLKNVESKDLRTLTSKEFSQKLIEVSENFIVKKAGNENFLKKLILNSIKIIDNKIILNTDNFLVLKNEEIYEFLINQEFIEVLQKMLIKNQLLVNNSGEMMFREEKKELNVFSSLNKELWAEGYWYWFGYWKLHFTRQGTIFMGNLLTDGASNLVDISNRLMETLAPQLAAPTVLALAVFALGTSWLFKKFASDPSNNGVTIHWYLIIPGYMTAR